jgi:hypothetical protein
MNSIERTILYCFPIVLMIVEAVILGAGWPGAWTFIPGPFSNFHFSFAGIAITVVTLRRREVRPLLLLGLLFEALRFMLFAWRHVDLINFLTTFGLGFWHASLVLPGLEFLRMRGPERMVALDRAVIRFSLPMFYPLSQFFLQMTSRYLHQTYDVFLYAFDGLLPIPAASIMGDLCAAHPPLRRALAFVYDGLEVAAILVVCLERLRDGDVRGGLITRWLLAGSLGYLIYFVMPGVGPHAAFDSVYGGKLPNPSEMDLSLLTYLDDLPRNALPSLHTAWVLLIAIAAWRMGPLIRVAGVAFAIAMLAATLGLREHYLIDLVVAVPFTVAVHGLASLSGSGANSRRHVLAIVGGAAMTIGWLLVIRYGTDPLRSAPWAASLLVLTTIATSAFLFLGIDDRSRQAKISAIAPVPSLS